jgi:hypothetical protein
MCWRPLTPPLRSAVVYLVRSFRTNARIRSLTTGTFNRVVKDRIAFRLSGAPSVLDGLATRANPAVLETFQPYRPRETLVNLHIPQHLHMISTCKLCSDLGYWGAKEARYSAQRYGLPLWTNTAPNIGARLFSHAKAEDRKLRKDPKLGGPCFEGTLQKPTGVSESSPVAGTT